MPRKSQRPESPDPAVRAIPFLGKSDKAQLKSLKNPLHRAIVSMVKQWKSDGVKALVDLVGQRADQSYVPLSPKPGRPPDCSLDRAAHIYIAQIDFKDGLRAQGHAGLHDDLRELTAAAVRCFPNFATLDEDGQADLLERIRDAVKYRRSRVRAGVFPYS